jgi:hypothetical protein
VVLNACYSAPQAAAIANHVDCVIGMPDAIGDAASVNFAAAFYQALAYGRDVQTAFELGCNQIDLQALAEPSKPRLLAQRCDPRQVIFAAPTAGSTGPRPVFAVPVALPPNYIPRPHLLAELRQALLSDAAAPPAAMPTDALHGMGGAGKSVLARALCDDSALQAAFPDGILWATLGRTPNLPARLREWIDALGGSGGDSAPTLDRLKAVLADLLRERACLLIADDVWRKADAEALRLGGPRCRLLLTTRDAVLAEELGARVHAIPLLAEAEAIALLGKWGGDGLRAAPAALLRRIVHRLGRLPLAVKLAGAQLQRQDPQRWLAAFDASQLQMRRVEEVHDSLSATVALSLDDLHPVDRRLYISLAIFKEDEPAPVAAIARLWAALDGRSAEASAALLDDLAARALLQPSEDASTAVAIHAILRDFMAAELGDAGYAAAHRALLAAYRQSQQGAGWPTTPDDGYLHSHLAYHLRQLASATVTRLLSCIAYSLTRRGCKRACLRLACATKAI